MKRNNIIITVLLSVLGILALAYFFIDSTEDEEKYIWNESYRTSSDQPYGTLFIKELLSNYRADGKFILNEKKSLSALLDSGEYTLPTDYIFIGSKLYLDEFDKEALSDFIFDGNDAFIASASAPLDVVASIFVNECNRDFYYDEDELAKVNFNFYHPTLKRDKGFNYEYRDHQKGHIYPWRYLNEELFCDSTKAMTPLGFLQGDQVNFVKLRYGMGHLYIHTNPIVFTNYFMCKPDKVDYASRVFSHLGGKDIIWDEYSKLQFNQEQKHQSQSPLSYILQHKSLKYAWWMMLGSVLLYTVFTAKRKQRIIPVLEEKVNTSLEFVKMISMLHFQNGDHMDIARKKMKYFLYFVRAKYGIHATPFTESHMRRLSEKSKIEYGDILAIFTTYRLIEGNAYSVPGENRLITLYNAIDKFYKHCK